MGRRRGRSAKVDWVYRNDTYADEQVTTYGGWGGDAETVAITAGPGNAQAFILLDSVNALRQASLFDEGALSTATTGILTAAARPDYKRLPTAIAVQGSIMWRSSSWLNNERRAIGVRLGWYEQDLDTGLLSLDTDYTIWSNSGMETFRGPALCANDVATHFKDWYSWSVHNGEAGTVQDLHMSIFWKGRRRAPSEKHCLALYCEQMTIGGLVGQTARRMVRALIG